MSHTARRIEMNKLNVLKVVRGLYTGQIRDRMEPTYTVEQG